jgi:hypothetical protein
MAAILLMVGSVAWAIGSNLIASALEPLLGLAH